MSKSELARTRAVADQAHAGLRDVLASLQPEELKELESLADELERRGRIPAVAAALIFVTLGDEAFRRAGGQP